MKTRCEWAGSDLLYYDYHDHEWGVPEHNDQKLFEMLILEGAQAGLSWITILKKRENYRKAFDNFNAAKIVKYSESKIQELLNNKGIVRNKLKVKAAIQNARGFLEIQKESGTFDTYIWQFVGGNPRKNSFEQLKDLPAKTTESEAMSKDLLKHGFKFVGPTICYAFMQAVGMVNDHMVSCFRYNEV
ncbi:DNA-3-methyladenine glycosylase I [candidate division KSB1 bacterium]|nr:DNA-3-methyladenine glycosylase I [candidate division KSB1 bacterium]